MQNDHNANQGNEESPVANDKLEEEGKNKDIEESNETVLTTDPNNDEHVISSRNKYQNSNLNNKKQSFLLNNKAEFIKNKTHMKNFQQNKVVYLITRDLFSAKKPTKNNDNFEEQLKLFFSNNASQLHVVNVIEEQKRDQFFKFIQFV